MNVCSLGWQNWVTSKSLGLQLSSAELRRLLWNRRKRGCTGTQAPAPAQRLFCKMANLQKSSRVLLNLTPSSGTVARQASRSARLAPCPGFPTSPVPRILPETLKKEKEWPPRLARCWLQVAPWGGRERGQLLGLVYQVRGESKRRSFHHQWSLISSYRAELPKMIWQQITAG